MTHAVSALSLTVAIDSYSPPSTLHMASYVSKTLVRADSKPLLLVFCYLLSVHFCKALTSSTHRYY